MKPHSWASLHPTRSKTRAQRRNLVFRRWGVFLIHVELAIILVPSRMGFRNRKPELSTKYIRSSPQGLPWNGPNVVGEPITLGKDVMVPRGIPGGTQKEVLDGGAPLDLATVHDHKTVIRAVSLHTVSVGCAEQDNRLCQEPRGDLICRISWVWHRWRWRVGFPLIVGWGWGWRVLASQCPVSEISLQRGTSGGLIGG